MNKVMNPEQMSKVTQQFAQEHMKMGITDEMSETIETFFLRLLFFTIRKIFQSEKRLKPHSVKTEIPKKKTPL